MPNLKLGIFFKTFVFFALAQVMGLFGSARIKELLNNVRPETTDFSVIEVLIFVLILGIMIFLFRKFGSKSENFYKFFLGFSIFLGSQALFSILVPDIFSIGLGAAAVYLFFKYRFALLHNLIIIVAITGIGIIFGISLQPIHGVILLLAFSAYDIIAVYKTKHMVKMAEDMIQQNAIFGIVVPFQTSDFFSRIGNGFEREKFMILGSGDVAFPTILIASAVVSQSFYSGLLVMLFSFAGLFITHLLFNLQKIRRPMAALPPIAVASIIGYLISSL